MLHKVFFVEDEIVTREGIRDNVNWKDFGFEYCGEAGDGEMALPLLQSIKPDLLITDIKMPFMDGLQLCKIVRERMPSIKIIILSGHDEFGYAQKAIELGVTEYLLKPVTVQNIHHSLRKIAVQLDIEKKKHAELEQLQDQLEENRGVLKERLLLKLVLGGVSSTEAIEQGQQFGLDLIARCYTVLIILPVLNDRSEAFDYDEYRQIQEMIERRIVNNPDIFLLKKDWEELILLLKGSSFDYLEEEKERLLGYLQQDIKMTRYHLVTGSGAPKDRLADIYQSFAEALAGIINEKNTRGVDGNRVIEKDKLLKINTACVEHYLRCGTKDNIKLFFDDNIRPLGEIALMSHLIKTYIIIDIIIATAKFVNEAGGSIDKVIPELNSIESIIAAIKSVENLQDQVCGILLSGLAFRDIQTHHHHGKLIEQARSYIDQHYMEAELSLNEISSLINLSPSHFSSVFAQKMGQTFKDYLTDLRMRKAQELLRTTALKSGDISYMVGYGDPHYFSFVFKKNTGFSPSEFRMQALAQ